MEVATTDLYRVPDPQMCQGDIIADVPHLHLQQPVKVLRTITAAKVGQVFQPFGLDTPPEDGLKFRRGLPEEVPASCLLARGILLTHGCEIDKDTKHRMVALIRPLEPVPPEAARAIREQRNFSFFYLPEYPGIFEESYVDFRRVSCIAPQLVDFDRRIASLTDTGLKQFLTKFFMYITRATPDSLDTLLSSRDL